jgi:hypothetical protein
VKQSKKALQTSYDACDIERTYLSFALQSALDGEVEWLRNQFGRVGIVRADSASGGVVIVRGAADKFPRVHGLEKWCDETVSRVNVLLGNGEVAREYAMVLDAERTLARMVLARRNEILDVAEGE